MMYQPLLSYLRACSRFPISLRKTSIGWPNIFLKMDEKKIEQFCALLLQVKQNVVKCDSCFTWREKERSCSFCASNKREKNIVCVVESWQELLAIEQTKGYTGVYHVLGGIIYPLEGVGPEDLTIEPLIKRVQEQGITEVILALSQTPEGEATSAYIANKLKGSAVTVTCLARGLPVGSSLGTMDRVTVFKALTERRLF